MTDETNTKCTWNPPNERLIVFVSVLHGRTHTYCVPLLLRALFAFGLLWYYFRAELKRSFCNAANYESPSKRRPSAAGCWVDKCLQLGQFLTSGINNREIEWKRASTKMSNPVTFCGCCHAPYWPMPHTHMGQTTYAQRIRICVMIEYMQPNISNDSRYKHSNNE